MKIGKFNILYDAGHGSSAKGAAASRLVDIFKVDNCSTNNYPNAGHCQTADTYIITNEGLSRLGDVVTDGKALTTVNMTGELEQISMFVPDGIRKINKVVLSNGVTLQCTDIHQYYVWDAAAGKRSWVRSMDLDPEVHQFLAPKAVQFPENRLFRDKLEMMQAPNKTNLRLPSDEVAFAKVLGLLVGDGYYAAKTKIDIAFHSSQNDTLEFAKDVFADLGVTNLPVYKVDGKECNVLSITQVSDLHRILDMAGLDKATKDSKSTPRAILSSNKAVVAGYLSGLFDSDGCAKSDRVTLSNCSRAVIEDAQQLLYIIGIHSTITIYLDKPGRTGSNRLPQYTLTISGRRNLENFARSVGFISRRKNELLDECIELTEDQGQIIKISSELRKIINQHGGSGRRNTRTSYIDGLPEQVDLAEIKEVCGRYHIIDIESITREYSEEEVFDITVPGTHSYIANGIISHNTVKAGTNTFISKVLPTPAGLNMWGAGKPNLWLGPGSGFFIEQLKKELQETGYAGSDKVFIHERATVVTDKHVELERHGGQWSTEHLASTMSGSGAGFATKAMRGQDVQLARDTIFKTMSPTSFADGIRSAMNGTFLHEVSQGYALSIDYGTHYPTCTYRNCTPQQAIADMMVLPSMVGDIYMNVRSFPIRVGNVVVDGERRGYSGDFCADQTELTWDQIAKDAEMPEQMADELRRLELTTVTKRLRRVATQSWSLLAESARLCGATKVILNFPQYIHWSAYKVRGGEAEFRSLHPKVRAYVDRLEEVTNLKVVMLGTSADHYDYIYRG